MPLPRDLSPEGLTPAKLWECLDADTKTQAVRSLYKGEWDDPGGRVEADAAIAAAIRFRDSAVRKLPLEKRVGYLLRAVRPDDSLANSLLLALHLDGRKAMLSAFLDELGIPQVEGMIDEDFDLDPPDPDRLRAAVRVLQEGFPADEVEVYLWSLLAIDPDTWGGLAALLGEAKGD